MNYEYVIDRNDVDKDPSKPLSVIAAQRRLRDRSRPHRGEGWRTRTRHGGFGPVRGWIRSRLWVWAIVLNGKAGTRAVMKSERTGAAFSVTKVEDSPQVTDLGCAPDLEVLHAYVMEWGKTNGGVRSGGRWYCRFVLGTRTVSKHGYVGEGWQGSAEDWFVCADTMSKLAELTFYVVDLAKQGRVNIESGIYADQEWRPSEGWTHYGGEYHRHGHFQVPGGFPCRP